MDASRNSPGPRKRVLIIGAGGHGRVVLDILQQDGTHAPVGFLDNNPAIQGRRVDGLPVHGGVGDLKRIHAELDIAGVIIAIGDNGTRRALARQADAAGIELVNAIHPAATLAMTTTLGRNVVICAGAVVCDHCQIGSSVILNTGCIVDYQTMIGEGSHICPGVRIGGRVKVESGAFVGIGATVIPNVTLGCECIIGAGSVVIEDVPSLCTVVGVPGRPVKLASASEDVAAMLLPARP
jgi:sugar O-acyltransferase (sialic acid O-acetyltransferase NeuD family)